MIKNHLLNKPDIYDICFIDFQYTCTELFRFFSNQSTSTYAIHFKSLIQPSIRSLNRKNWRANRAYKRISERACAKRRFERSVGRFSQNRCIFGSCVVVMFFLHMKSNKSERVHHMISHYMLKEHSEHTRFK